MSENTSMFYQVPLYSLELPSKYVKLIQKIIKLNDSLTTKFLIETVGDVLEIDANKLSKCPRIGNSSIEILFEFKSELHKSARKIENAYQKMQIQEGNNNVNFNLTKMVTFRQEVQTTEPTVAIEDARLETSLNQLALLPQYEKLIKRISSSMGVVNMVQDILDIDPIEFSNVPAVGKTYVDLLINFQNEFVPVSTNMDVLEQIEIVKEIEEVEELPPQITLSAEQLETPVNQLAISVQYQSLVKKISIFIDRICTVQDILEIDQVQFSELPAVGKIYVNQLIELQKQLPAFLEKQTQKSALFTENYSIEFNEIDNVLIEDVEGYLWTLDEIKMDVALSRWGFNQPHENLDEIGNRYGITRERIRQIEKPINANLPLNFRIQPKVLWANIREKMTEDLTILLPNLAKCFATEKLFYDFIERCCQVESGSISKIVFTKISSKIINSFFCFNPSPISQEIIVNELMSNYGHSKASAVNGLKQLSKNDRIEITAEGIYPKKLGKTEAVAHVLTFHPAGLPWKDIARIANKKSYLSTSFNEKVQATSALSCSEYVYLSGHGTYRNLMFLDLEQFNIPEIMQHLLDYFEQRKLNALHLHDYYQQNKMQRTEIEYFTLRHIVRGYGEEYGVFFNGQSGSDSVSIDKNATRITQADVVVSMLNESKVAMTIHEIAALLRSKSTGHAAFYLDGLMERGEVVRVDKMVYTTPEKAFGNMNIDVVMQIVKDIMNTKNAVVEADVFREYVNMELNLSYSKYIYIALVRSKLNELSWYRNNTLFGKTPIPYKNLADMCRQLCKQELSNSENAKILQRAVWLTNSVTFEAIHQWKIANESDRQ